jgi:NAD(P)-dependent dehydrogenase (short-subunit alcohol dehydrogenase family)
MADSRRVVIVTGGARGIGLAIARAFKDEGAAVTSLDIEPVEGGDSRIEHVRCDVSNSAAVDSTVQDVVDRHGQLDVMVANAGIGGGGPIAELDDDLIRRVIDVNLFGVVACCRAAARVMIPRKRGAIVTIGSIFGQDPPAGSAVYGATKAGVTALTKSLARELGAHGIRVNCVSPGHIETDLYARALQRRAEQRRSNANANRSRSATSARPSTSPRLWCFSVPRRPRTLPGSGSMSTVVCSRSSSRSSGRFGDAAGGRVYTRPYVGGWFWPGVVTRPYVLGSLPVGRGSCSLVRG